MSNDYTKTTKGVRVSVRSFYLEDQSQADEGRFVWAYRVTIENKSQQTVQLISRTWRITNGIGARAARPWRGRHRRAACTGTRRIVRIHLRDAARHADGPS